MEQIGQDIGVIVSQVMQALPGKSFWGIGINWWVVIGQLSSSFAILFAACQEQKQRYTQKSTEIETVKTLIKNYNDKTYDVSIYADTSKTFYNSKDKSLSPSETIAYHQANDSIYSSRGFLAEDQEYEMVETDDKIVFPYSRLFCDVERFNSYSNFSTDFIFVVISFLCSDSSVLNLSFCSLSFLL
jgi:hypothetical protein